MKVQKSALATELCEGKSTSSSRTRPQDVELVDRDFVRRACGEGKQLESDLLRMGHSFCVLCFGDWEDFRFWTPRTSDLYENISLCGRNFRASIVSDENIGVVKSK
jgi:hypothetical protein